jgi:murein DD-endopeptidase MepM/ murein hydrolase activator NlpD
MTDLRIATITGGPLLPDVNVRSGPGTDFDVLFKALKGVTDLTVVETRDDCAHVVIDGHLMQWHRLAFPNGREGWIREDLLSVRGQSSQGAAGNISIVAPPIYVPPAPVANTPRIVAVAGVSVRSAPTTEATRLGVLNHGSEAVVTGVHNDKAGLIDQATGLVFRWYGLSIGGYVREDVVRRLGDWSQFGLSAQSVSVEPTGGLWPSPVIVAYSFTNGFNLDPKHYHRGWDFATEGSPSIYAAPVPGIVVKRADCAKCGPEGKSSYPEFALNDRRIWNDPDWGFGFGHHIIIQHLNETLPQPTKDFLALKGWQGWHAYCLYGHLSAIHVSA